MTEEKPGRRAAEGRAGRPSAPPSLAQATRAIRDIGDALVVLSQSDRIRDYPLIALAGPLREAARRNFLFVIREQDIPVAVVVLHRRPEGEDVSSVPPATPALVGISDWETGPRLALLDFFSVRGDSDHLLRAKAVEVLEKVRSTL